MFPIDSLVLDLVFGIEARPTPENLLEGLGGEEIAKTRAILDPDVDAPQYEMEVSPSVPLRRRGERRLLVVDETVAPLRKDPRRDPIVAKDLRAEKNRLVALVEKTGARWGRLNAFGTWGDAAIVVRSVRDLRGLALLGWALDPTVDIDGRRRANQLSEAEFTEKLAAFDKRLDELDDASVLARVPPASLERRGTLEAPLFVVSLLSDVDGSWDIRKSYELEKRLGAVETFSRIPGARAVVAQVVDTEATAPVSVPVAAAAAAPAAVAKSAAAPAPAAAAPTESPKPAGPPIHAVELDGRVVLQIPAERFDLDSITSLGRKNVDVLGAGDAVTGAQKDKIHHDGCGFVAPLAFLSEVFLDGKPLDRKRFDAESQELPGGLRALEAHLPRFGPVRVVQANGKRWVTSELALDPTRLAPFLG